MISLSRVSAKMSASYYTKDCYYTKENTIHNSEWYGQGASILGLAGKIDPKVFQGQLNAITQNTNASKKEDARIAIDVTFSAPKSVSIASLVGGDKRIIEAHNNAVNSALKTIEERFSWTRTGSKENRQIEVANNIIAAKFEHDVSRAKDPQLHTHCVILNKVQRVDGQWRSLHNDGIFNHSKYLGFIYQNELAYELKNIGYEVLLNRNGTFDIKGYDEKQLQEFSKRTRKIKELNCKTKKQERIEKLLDRPSKGKAIPREVLLEKWQEEAASVGIKHPIPNKKNLNIDLKTQHVFAQKLLEDGIKHITERDVRFKQEDLEKFVISQNIGQISSKSYERGINRLKISGELIEYKKGYFTTKEALLIEGNIIKSIEVGKEKFTSIIAKDIPQKIFSEELNLTNGQKDALVTSLKTKDQFIAWQGVAGAGKTYAMDILREIATDQGFKIKGFAPSAEAAQTLEKDSSIPSRTVTSLLVKEEPKIFNHGNKEIWIVDEAGLLCARDCEKLMEKATYQNARVIFVGDTKQMSAIEAGNPFKLMQVKGIEIARLNESIRQKENNLKTSVDLISKDKIHDGLNKISKDIIEIQDSLKKFEFIKHKYTNLSPQEQEKTLVLASTNDERKQITDLIRTDLINKKQIKDQITITQLVQKNMTLQESKSALNYQVGDVLVFYKDNKQDRLWKNTQYVVREIDIKKQILLLNEDITESNKSVRFSPLKGGFSSYEMKKIPIATGDKVRCTKNDNLFKIRNGQDFIITSTKNNQVKIKSKSGREISFSTNNPLHLDHNYVNTVYSSQGKTCDRVIIAGNKSFGKEMLYVALSRAKYEATVVTQNKDDFIKAVANSKAKISAFDLMPKTMPNKIAINTEIQNKISSSPNKIRF